MDTPAETASNTLLPPLPLAEWEPTKDTLHLYAQIVGKIRLTLMPKQNHWWHVPLYISARGFTTRPIPYHGFSFEIQFDFIDHRLQVVTSRGDMRGFPLRGQPVAEFYSEVMALLDELGIEVTIRAVPYGTPISTTPFQEDREHASYDAGYARRFWEILCWNNGVFAEFAGGFVGKSTPVHLFWHSFDLALTRFSGRRAPEMDGANQVNREAYSHEVISFGFWAGDQNVREPAYYSYVWPEPSGLRQEPLKPAEAFWADNNGSSMALYRYDDLRNAPDPRQALLEFLESAYQAGGRLGEWDLAGLERKG